MKTKFYYRLALSFAFFSIGIKAYCETGSIQNQILVAAREGSVSSLSAIGDKSEFLWTNDAVLYFQIYNQLGAALETLASTNPTALQELKKQADDALSKKCPTNSAAAISSFGLKSQIAERLMRSSSPNVQDAEILAKFLGEVRTTIIANYQRARVLMNVSPPIAPTNGLVFSGMDPKAITDPVARAAYEKAIDENNKRGFENDLQFFTLPDANRTITPLFLDYIKKLFIQNPEARKQIDKLATLAHLTTDEKKQLQ